jgi:hypothetical protein
MYFLKEDNNHCHPSEAEHSASCSNADGGGEEVKYSHLLSTDPYSLSRPRKGVLFYFCDRNCHNF